MEEAMPIVAEAEVAEVDVGWLGRHHCGLGWEKKEGRKGKAS
jgi:hypothetical protein